ncbi:DUF805 domain-containing protein [Agarivorans sp. B2Z047]|uniref:DUF805 domain-containing protein n=1 Tax=Agarivorans sp. B2Z047 TaxID=2652721 RepID=UPI00128E1584|nr:DUF805 domain-containing protein [Agarivorans sp. B2Z047]MPW29769.1 DUF805 domain-containing protein [Agarivorans sp. B2Z047]UQN43337.1 DUF805 domain-containing protein [Agarivorans sp. B2Z047]
MSWYIAVLKKYLVFNGRARRKEYWMFVLINSIIGVILSFIDQVTGTVNLESGLGVLGSIYTLAVLLPSLAVAVRRLHDTGRSGWWLFILFLPIIGVLVLLFFFLSDSKSEANAYGENPKAQAV